MDQQIISLAQTLIQRPSISPNDKGCQQFIASLLLPLGFHLEWFPFNDTLNLWVTHGVGKPCLVFAGHTDVVPTGNESQWDYPPFSAHIEGDKLYGRGAADMKGSLAATVIAVADYVQQNPNHLGRVGLLITSDEEASAKDGTKRVVETLMNRGEKIDYCVVAEPSSTLQLGDVIKNGRRGSITADLLIKGVLGHVAYPHLALNPIHQALSFLQALTDYSWDNGNAFFPPTSLQITQVRAGVGSNNVIPGELFVQFNLRYSTEVTDQTIQDKVTALLKTYGLNYQIDWHLSGQPFLTSTGKLLDVVTQAVHTYTQQTPKLETTGGTSDGRFIALMGAEVVELGPINATIHKMNEWVSCQDLCLLGKIYQKVIVELLS